MNRIQCFCPLYVHQCSGPTSMGFGEYLLAHIVPFLVYQI